jgi:homeobox-leucine zipper protein
MGFDDHSCNTGLVLGLGFSDQPPSKSPLTTTKKPAFSLSFELALSPAFPGEESAGVGGGQRQVSPQSGGDVSGSFSSGGTNRAVKRERDISTSDQEADVEISRMVSNSRISDEDEDAINARKKLRLTKDQSALLEERFKQHSTLNPKQKQALARQLNLRPRQVEVWFQNRRARTKLKQTETDCEFLKKCCETLSEENRRLEKELQELKALKLSQPFYMHMPAATLTMCPSCERIGGSGGGAGETLAAVKSPFSKPNHFFNPFANPSAAC